MPDDAKPTSIDKGFLKKMEIFAGDENTSNHLFGKIAHTQTIAGEALLTRILTQPTYDINTLEKRKKIVQELVQNPNLLEQLDTVLQKVKNIEHFLYAYFQKEHPVNEELYKKVYFNDRLSYLNKSPIALELSTRWSDLWSTLGCTWLPLNSVLQTSVGQFQQAQLQGQPISKVTALAKGLKTSLTYCDLRLKAYDKNIPISDWQFSSGRVPQPETIGDTFYLYEQLAKNNNLPANVLKGTHLAIYAIMGSIYAYTAHNSYNTLKLRKDIANNLQTRLIGINSFVRYTSELYQHIEKTLPSLIEETTTLSFDKSLTKHRELLRLLNHNTFNGDASFFSLTGRVLAAHQLMKEVKDQFTPFVEFVGTIDSYVSIAKLYKKHEQTPVHYSFVDFIENDRPYIKATNFWNPFIDASKVVPSSIELGSYEKPNNIILTGPNTGGKSTVIKGLLLNILLAQSFGIAPSDHLQMTPFADINCYLNITDDISAGASLFKAEVLRAKRLIEGIRNLQPHEFSFTIMDEVFSGTSPKEGKKAAYEFAQQLGNFPNSMCSIATHFSNLTGLEKHSTYKNYQVTVFKNSDGTWHRPFKLEEGASSQNIAMELLKEEGIF